MGQEAEIQEPFYRKCLWCGDLKPMNGTVLCSDCEEKIFYGKCLSCDDWGLVNHSALCSDCEGKIQRNFIRQRHWNYVEAAFVLPPAKREELRQQVIKKYGEKLEIFKDSSR